MRERKCISKVYGFKIFFICFVSKVSRLDLYFILLNFALFRGKLRMLFLGKLILFKPKNFLGTSVFQDVPAFLFFGHKDVPNFLEFHLKLIFCFLFLLSILFQNFGSLSTSKPYKAMA